MLICSENYNEYFLLNSKNTVVRIIVYRKEINHGRKTGGPVG